MIAIWRKKYPSAFPKAARWKWALRIALVTAAISGAVWITLCLSGCAVVGTTIKTPNGWRYTEGGIVWWKGNLVDLTGTATLGNDTIVERSSGKAETDATALASLMEKIFDMAFTAGKTAAAAP